jgi:hypothetical protein
MVDNNAMAYDPNYPEDYEHMLKDLKNEISLRLKNGKCGPTIEQYDKFTR